ncbi:hypothetical protein B0H11DRAFT_2249190 [Mycena galericulata]|nr:hypothetical protein B0H11DRAFT_2249190 [Mycena galericulata]
MADAACLRGSTPAPRPACAYKLPPSLSDRSSRISGVVRSRRSGYSAPALPAASQMRPPALRPRRSPATSLRPESSTARPTGCHERLRRGASAFPSQYHGLPPRGLRAHAHAAPCRHATRDSPCHDPTNLRHILVSICMPHAVPTTPPVISPCTAEHLAVSDGSPTASWRIAEQDDCSTVEKEPAPHGRDTGGDGGAGLQAPWPLVSADIETPCHGVMMAMIGAAYRLQRCTHLSPPFSSSYD